MRSIPEGALRRLTVGLLLVGFSCFQNVTYSQSYPTKPIRVIVGFPPGGASDTSARLIAPRLGELLGQPVIVDNRPGANTNIAMEFVTRAQPDGYTVLWGFSNGLVVNPALYGNLPFDPLRDLAPVSLIDQYQFVLVVHKSVPAKSVKELIALVKSAKPGEFEYASAGLGGNNHLAAELFKRLAGIDIIHVPYKGGGPAIMSVVVGETKMFFASITSVLGHIKSGAVTPLAVTAPQRARELPGVLTMQEQGFAGFDVRAWDAVLVPVGTPQAVIEKLNSMLLKVAAMPEIQEGFRKAGLDLTTSSPEELVARIKRETVSFREITKDAGIKLE